MRIGAWTPVAQVEIPKMSDVTQNDSRHRRAFRTAHRTQTGSPPSAEQGEETRRGARKNLKARKRRRSELPGFRKDQENRFFPQGKYSRPSDFQLIGRRARRGQAGLRAFWLRRIRAIMRHGKFGKMFSKVEGQLWDRQNRTTVGSR